MGLGAVALAPGAALLSSASKAFGDEDENGNGITAGDAALLRFAAARGNPRDRFLGPIQRTRGEFQTSKFRVELGIQPTPKPLKMLDEDMDVYVHDNTEDEFTHFTFLNAYLVSKGARPVNLERFRTLPGSTATGSSGKPRLTNLMQLTLDTSWWTRYRSRTHNPDLDPNFTFPQAIPTLHHWPAYGHSQDRQ